MLVPLLGGDFTLPMITKAEATGSYRWVDNSLAGKNDAWSYGGRWPLFGDLTLRGTKSSTFRAPRALLELLLPRRCCSRRLSPATKPPPTPAARAGHPQANCRAPPSQLSACRPTTS